MNLFCARRLNQNLERPSLIDNIFPHFKFQQVSFKLKIDSFVIHHRLAGDLAKPDSLESEFFWLQTFQRISLTAIETEPKLLETLAFKFFLDFSFGRFNKFNFLLF